MLGRRLLTLALLGGLIYGCDNGSSQARSSAEGGAPMNDAPAVSPGGVWKGKLSIPGATPLAIEGVFGEYRHGQLRLRLEVDPVNAYELRLTSDCSTGAFTEAGLAVLDDTAQPEVVSLYLYHDGPLSLVISARLELRRI